METTEHVKLMKLIANIDNALKAKGVNVDNASVPIEELLPECNEEDREELKSCPAKWTYSKWLAKKLLAMPFEGRGHKLLRERENDWITPEERKKRLEEDLSTKLWSFCGFGEDPNDECGLLIRAIQKSVEIPWVELYLSSQQCCNCGAHFAVMETNGKVFRVKEVTDYRFLPSDPQKCQRVVLVEDCPFAGGIKPFVVEVDIPSGKMIIDDDLRPAFPAEGDCDVNYIYGQLLEMKAYEKVGMAHGFIGNSCASVWKQSDTYLTVGGKKGKCINSICTDLWWYSIADYEEAKRRMKGKKFCHCAFTVDVKPGVYRVKHYTHIKGTDDTSKVMASIKWVRPSGSPKKITKNDLEAWGEKLQSAGWIPKGCDVWEDPVSGIHYTVTGAYKILCQKEQKELEK